MKKPVHLGVWKQTANQAPVLLKSDCMWQVSLVHPFRKESVVYIHSYQKHEIELHHAVWLMVQEHSQKNKVNNFLLIHRQ